MAKEIIQQKAELTVDDGTRMSAYVSRPQDESPNPGMIVLQEAFGVNSHIRNVADRFAREGYLSIAPELFHRTAPGFEGDYTNFAAVMPHTRAVTPAGAEADVKATFAWLQAQKDVSKDKIFSVGFCMGGRVSFLANAVLPLRGAVSFYGGGMQGILDLTPQLHARMLLFWGGLDKHITVEHRRAVADALTANGKSYVNVEFSDADHGFFCDERAAYNPGAARQAWALMLEFLSR